MQSGDIEQQIESAWKSIIVVDRPSPSFFFVAFRLQLWSVLFHLSFSLL